jgi:hypothetical protein
MGGRDRASRTVRIEFGVADIDIDLSCVTRSRRKAGPGTVRTESDDRREVVARPIEGSARVEDAGEVLIKEVRVPAMTVVSSWR